MQESHQHCMRKQVQIGHHPWIWGSYVSDLPDDTRYNRLQQQNLRKRCIDSVDDCDEDNETGVGCQTKIVELNNASCQTDKDLAELTILQRKEYIDLKKENNILTAEIAEMKST